LQLTWLGHCHGFQEVEEELKLFAKGCTGVPFFIFNVEGETRRAVTMSGAQPPEMLLEALEEMAN
jgi:predicted DsbA family dithiol-disulfide isomerase